VNVNEKVCPGVRTPDAHLPSPVGDVPLVVVWLEGPLFVGGLLAQGSFLLYMLYISFMEISAGN